MQVSEKDVTEALIKEKLIKRYPKLEVLFKQGSHGATLISNDFTVQSGSAGSYNEQIGKDYKILNTVGAGDCLTGAFAAAYYEKFSKRDF